MSIYRRPDNPYYYCEFMDSGRPVRKSTGVLISDGSKRAIERAIAQARQEEGRLKEAHFSKKRKSETERKGKPDITFEAFSTTFLEWAKTQHATKPKTVTYYNERIASLLRYEPLKKAMLSRIDEELVAGFTKWRSTSTKTIALRDRVKKTRRVPTVQRISVATTNRDLAVLRRVLNVAESWKYRTEKPKIRLLSGEEGCSRVISHDEEKRYLAAAPELLRDFATIAIDTGFRPDSELCAMRWENVHLNPVNGARFGYVHVPRGKTANSKRNVPLTGRASKILNRRWEDADQPREGFVFEREDGSAIPYTTIDTQHDRTLPKLNAKGPNGEAPEHPVAHFRIYDLRHAFGTRLGEAGADAYSIMKLMGHGSITISCRYVHPTPERLETALARLDVYNETQAKKQPASVTAIDTKIA